MPSPVPNRFPPACLFIVLASFLFAANGGMVHPDDAAPPPGPVPPHRAGPAVTGVRTSPPFAILETIPATRP